MEYNRITYFLKAAQTLNFTRAAEELYISRQALAKQIALFEEELGVVLFERSTRKITLTKAGQEAYKRLFRANAEMEKALNAVRSLAPQQQKPKVVIGFFADIQRSIISNITKYLSETFPMVTFEIVIHEMFGLRDALIQGKIDLCITNTMEDEFWEHCSKFVMGRYPAQVLVSKNHPWAQRKYITVEDMMQEEFIMLKDDRVDLEGFFENIPCKRQIWMPNLSSLMLRLDQGSGFAVALKYSNNFLGEQMVGFPVPYKDVIIEISCLWNNEKTNDYTIKVVDVIAELFT